MSHIRGGSITIPPAVRARPAAEMGALSSCVLGVVLRAGRRPACAADDGMAPGVQEGDHDGHQPINAVREMQGGECKKHAAI